MTCPKFILFCIFSLTQPQPFPRRKDGLRGTSGKTFVSVPEDCCQTYRLANFLFTSPSTAKRDMVKLWDKGEWIPTRGLAKDIGKGTSHKTKIVELYLRDFQITEIALRTRHSLEAIKHYLGGFSHCTKLFRERLSVQEIRLITGFSKRIIDEYIKIYLYHRTLREDCYLSWVMRALLSLRQNNIAQSATHSIPRNQLPEALTSSPGDPFPTPSTLFPRPL